MINLQSLGLKIGIIAAVALALGAYHWYATSQAYSRGYTNATNEIAAQQAKVLADTAKAKAATESTLQTEVIRYVDRIKHITKPVYRDRVRTVIDGACLAGVRNNPDSAARENVLADTSRVTDTTAAVANSATVANGHRAAIEHDLLAGAANTAQLDSLISAVKLSDCGGGNANVK